MIEDKNLRSNRRIICLIDNYQLNFPTNRIERFNDIIQKNFDNIDLKKIHYFELDPSKCKDISGYILSGSNSNVSEFYSNKKLRKDYKRVVKLIQYKNQKPILAICYGHQLTAYAFDGKVQRMSGPNRGSRIIPLSLEKVDELIPYDEISVNVQHMDYVLPADSNIQKNFDIIAVKEIDSYNTIQYMRHVDRPIFSVQFHPETYPLDHKYAEVYDEQKITETKSLGEEIIKNFISICIR